MEENPPEGTPLNELDAQQESQLKEVQRLRAERIVGRIDADTLAQLSPSFVDEYRAYTQLKANLHLGVDAHGERLTGEARRILQQTSRALEEKLAARYAHNSPVQLQRLLGKLHIDELGVSDVLARRPNPTEPSPSTPQTGDNPSS